MASNNEPEQEGFDPNLNLESFPQSTYRSLIPSQQYYPHIPNTHIPKTNTMRSENDSGEVFLTNAYRSDIGMFNDNSFTQNHFFSSPLDQASHNPFSNAHPTPPTIPHIPQQLNSRAAELKAKLLKQRASSTTSSAGMAGHPAHSNRTESSSSLRGSPIARHGDERNQEHDVDQLISEYSQDVKPAAGNLRNKQEIKNDSRPQPPLRSSTAPTSSVVIADSLGSPKRVSKPIKNGNTILNAAATAIAMERESSGYSSGLSEGEIFDDPPQTDTLSWAPSKPDSKSPSVNDQVTYRPRSNSVKDTQMPPAIREDAPRPRSATSTKSQPARDQGLWDSINRPERRTYQPNRNGHRIQTGRDAQPKSQEVHGSEENHRRTSGRAEPTAEPTADGAPTLNQEKSKVPTLAQVLPYDNDLRDWLEITAYHNVAYREKTLRRHRALDALNTQSEEILAKRNALIAEMEAEEDDAIPLIGRLIMKANTTPAPTPPTLKPKTQAPSPFKPEPEPLSRPYPNPNKRPRSLGSPPSPTTAPSKLQRRDSHVTNATNDSNHYHRPRSRSPRRTSRFDDYFDHEDGDARLHEGRGNYRGKYFDPNYHSRGRGRARGEYHGTSDSRSESGSKGAIVKKSGRGGKGAW